MPALTDEPFEIREFEDYRQRCRREGSGALQMKILLMQRRVEAEEQIKMDATKKHALRGLAIAAGLTTLFTLQTCIFDDAKKSSAAEPGNQNIEESLSPNP